jgi:hypothetical protein
MALSIDGSIDLEQTLDKRKQSSTVKGMSAIKDFTTAHGCGCGSPGTKVSERSLDSDRLTRNREVIVKHESGVRHATVYRMRNDGMETEFHGTVG